MPLLKKHGVIMLAVALWLPAVMFGIGVLWRYSSTPGAAATPQPYWPSGTSREQNQGRPTLVMFAHPHCQCSRASIGELAIIMARVADRLEARVYFYLAPGEASSWTRTDLWESAASIPGVRVLEDRDGAAARMFGARTSGQVLLYDGDGRLLYEGGVTAFRGHFGDNEGLDTIVAMARNEARAGTLPKVKPVFGCSLRGESTSAGY